MEPQNQPIDSNPQPTAEPAKKCKHTAMIVILAILAIGGIGFGGYEFWQNIQKDDEIKNLQAENIKAEESENEIAEENKEIENNPVFSGAVGGPYIKDGYFYVPEWGLKFNIPSDLTNYGYSVNYALAHGEGNVDTNSPQIGFTAMLKNDITYDALDWTYDTIETCAIVSVSKEEPGWDDYDINGFIKDFDGYTLLIWNYSRHGSCDLGRHIDEVQEKIQTMFSNPESI